MMETFAGWENIVLGVLVLLILFWFQPGIKSAVQRSKNTPSDWKSVFLPLSMVVLFIIFLIVMV